MKKKRSILFLVIISLLLSFLNVNAWVGQCPCGECWDGDTCKAANTYDECIPLAGDDCDPNFGCTGGACLPKKTVKVLKPDLTTASYSDYYNYCYTASPHTPIACGALTYDPCSGTQCGQYYAYYTANIAAEGSGTKTCTATSCDATGDERLAVRSYSKFCGCTSGDYCRASDYSCQNLLTCAEANVNSYGFNPQEDNEDLYNDCSPSWDSCDSSCVKRGGDGACAGGAYACDTNDATDDVADGKVCSLGSEKNPSDTLYCDRAIDCATGSCSADIYNRACDGSGSCSETGKVISSTNFHAGSGTSISETNYKVGTTCTTSASACSGTDHCIGETWYTGYMCDGSGGCTLDYGAQDKDDGPTFCVSTASGCTQRVWNTPAAQCCGDDGAADDFFGISAPNCIFCNNGAAGSCPMNNICLGDVDDTRRHTFTCSSTGCGYTDTKCNNFDTSSVDVDGGAIYGTAGTCTVGDNVHCDTSGCLSSPGSGGGTDSCSGDTLTEFEEDGQFNCDSHNYNCNTGETSASDTDGGVNYNNQGTCTVGSDGQCSGGECISVPGTGGGADTCTGVGENLREYDDVGFNCVQLADYNCNTGETFSSDPDGSNYENQGTCTVGSDGQCNVNRCVSVPGTGGGADYCSGVNTLIEYTKLGSFDCTSTPIDCNDYDDDNCGCSTSGDTLTESCQDWNCNGGKCGNSGGVLDTDWICNAGNECNLQSCQGTQYRCYRTNAGNWEWSSVPLPAETNCADTFNNDCDANPDCADTNDCHGRDGPASSTCCRAADVDSDCNSITKGDCGIYTCNSNVCGIAVNPAPETVCNANGCDVFVGCTGSPFDCIIAGDNNNCPCGQECLSSSCQAISCNPGDYLDYCNAGLTCHLTTPIACVDQHPGLGCDCYSCQTCPSVEGGQTTFGGDQCA